MRFQLSRLIPFVFLATMLLGGCVVVPVPNPKGMKKTAHWEKRVKGLLADKAPREAGVQSLGRPKFDYPDLRVVGYGWQADEWGFLWAWGAGQSGDMGYAKIHTDRVLWLAFDVMDRLTQYELAKHSDKQAPWEQATRFRNSVSRSTASPPPTTS
jgi:hypothetical protein